LLAAAWFTAGPKKFSAYDPEVDRILKTMTLEEKIGQMTQADHNALKDPAGVEKYLLGSGLNGDAVAFRSYQGKAVVPVRIWIELLSWEGRV
jgi:hypothetical protein